MSITDSKIFQNLQCLDRDFLICPGSYCKVEGAEVEGALSQNLQLFTTDIPNYSFYQIKTTTSKGSSALCVLNSLACAERKDLNTRIHGELETTFVEIGKNKEKNIICGSIYRHPNSNIDEFFIYAMKILDRLSKEDVLYLWEILI